jgi:hypothetical protein
MPSIPSSQLLLCLKPLRREGIFVKDIEYFDEKQHECSLTLANYITDTDDGRDIDCLYEKGDIDADSCYCEAITCGTQTSDTRCVPCPFCGVSTKPYALKERLYTAKLAISLEKGVTVITNGSVPSEMMYVVILNIYKKISEINGLAPRLDLSGGSPSYGFTFRDS